MLFKAGNRVLRYGGYLGFAIKNFQLFGSLSGTNKWLGGVLAPNGRIYCVPLSSTQILEIDPETQTTQLFGSLAGVQKWSGGVLAPNGRIYCVPYNSTQVLEYRTQQSPSIADITIPQNLANLPTSNYNKYYNKL